MEHKLISGGEQYLPFARSRIKALRATGLNYATQRFVLDDAEVEVSISGAHDHIKISGGKGVVAFMQDAWYPNTNVGQAVIYGGVKLRIGDCTNQFATSKTAVSPFSNKNISVRENSAGLGSTTIDGSVYLVRRLEFSINGIVVHAEDMTTRTWRVSATTSAHDSAAIVLWSFSQQVGGSEDTRMSSFSAEFVRDSDGAKVLDENQEPVLEMKRVDFSNIPVSRLASDPATYGWSTPFCTVDEKGALFVLTTRRSAADYSSPISARVYTGKLPTQEAIDFFLPPFTDAGFADVSMFASNKGRLYIQYYWYDVGFVQRFAMAVFKVKWAPVFEVTKEKEFALPTPILGGMAPAESGASVVSNGIFWCSGACIDTHKEVVALLPNPIVVAPQYIAVSADGLTARYYWTNFSASSLAESTFQPAGTQFQFGPLRNWPMDVAGIPYNDQFVDGEVRTYRLSTATDGSRVVADISPVDVEKTAIRGTKYHHTPVAPYPGSVLQFEKP